jgi:polyisoprenoid-binding protein YceI
MKIGICLFLNLFCAYSYAATSKNFAVCEIRYSEGNSNSSVSSTITTVRFKSDHIRIKKFNIEKTKFEGTFEFSPLYSEITLSANGKSNKVDANELFSNGRTWVKSEINANAWLTASCESKDLEEAFYDLMRAYDEKVGQ